MKRLVMLDDDGTQREVRRDGCRHWKLYPMQPRKEGGCAVNFDVEGSEWITLSGWGCADFEAKEAPPARCRYCRQTLDEHHDDGPDARMMCLGKKHGFVAEDVAEVRAAEWTCKRCGVDAADGERARHVCSSQNVQAHRDKRIDEIEQRVRKLEEVVQP